MNEILVFEDHIQVETQDWITEIINKSKLICENCNSWNSLNKMFGYCENKKLNENKIKDKDSLIFVTLSNFSKSNYGLIKTGKDFGCIHFNEKL